MTGQHSHEPPATTVPTGIPSLEVVSRVRRRELPELLVVTGM